MKLSRPLLIVAGSLLALAVIAVVTAFTPAFQRWAVLRATASTPGLKLELARVSAGFSQLELRDVKVEQNGLVVQVAKLDASYSISQLVFGNRLKIDRLAASGIVVDATKLDSAGKAAGAGAPAAAPGVLADIILPFELVLDNVQLDGRALLAASETSAPLEAVFKISGGRFSPGQEGSLLLSGSVKNPAADAPVTALNAQITLRATQTAQRGFDRVAVTAVLDAEGSGLSGRTQLKIAADLARGPAGENYTVNVDTLIGGTAENVLVLKAALPAGEKEFAGQWTLKARKAQLAPFFLGGILPEFETGGEGRFVFAPAPLKISLQGRLDTTLSRLELIEPSWRAFGVLKTGVVFDVESADRVAKLNQLKISVTGEKPVLDLEALNAVEFDFAKGRLQVGGAGVSEVLDVKLHGVPVAWVRPFVAEADISGGMISGRFSVTSEGGRLFVRSPQLLKIEALNVVKQGALLLAKADISLRPEAELTPTELKATVKDFSLRTAAGDTLTAQTAVTVPISFKPPFAVSASYTTDLPTLIAAWVPIGRIKSSGEVDFTLQADNTVELRRFSASVSDGAGELLFNAASVRSFGLNLATGSAITGATKAADLVKITLGAIPLAKVPLSQSGMQLSGALNSGEFMLSSDGSKITLNALAPVKLAGVGLRNNGQVALTGLNIQAQPVIELGENFSVSAKSGEVRVTNAAGLVLLTLQGEGSHSRTDGTRAGMTFNVDVPALGSQPAFAGAKSVTQGKASGEIRAVSGTQHQVEARLTINGLVARDVAQTLPVANLSLRAILEPDGKILLQAPLLLDRAGQRSDLNFALELLPKGELFILSGKLSGEHVELADALAVLGVFQSSPQPAAQPVAVPVVSAPTSATIDMTPAWARVNGQFLLDIKSVTHGKAWSMSGLTGVVALEPAKLSLQKFETIFDEKSKLTAAADIKFSPGTRPYRLDGAFTLTEFDAGKFFKAFDPGKAPTVEGLFNVKGTLVGDGENIARTVERARGSFELTSKQGVFRGLARATGKLSVASKAVEFGASVLGSIFGSEKATKTAEKVAGQAYFVDQLAQSLGEFNYDQLTVKLTRDESLNVTMEDVSLVSPEIRLIGKGALAHVEGKSLLDYPLTMSLTLSSRGKIEQLLGKVHVTDTTKDELGFTKSREVLTIGGSLTKPDATAFFTKLATAKLGEFLAPGN